MEFFMSIKRSMEKTKVMGKLIDALKDSPYSPNTETQIKAFYDYISADYILGPIIAKYNANYEIVKMLILKLNETVGGHYGGWYRNQYIPVSTFGFSNSLECALKEYSEGSSIDLILYEVQKLM
jgi:hypothetical protein